MKPSMGARTTHLSPLIIILLVFMISISTTTCQLFYNSGICSGPSNSSANPSFNASRSSLLSTLSAKSSFNSFYTSSSNGIYGLYLCRGDVSSQTCQDCISNATQKIVQVCPSNGSAIVWYDQCMLRYSNENFIGTAEEFPMLFMYNLQNTSNLEPDYGALALVYDLIDSVPDSSLMFGTKESSDKYALTQCTRDINSTECQTCLGQLINHINQCCQLKVGWRVMGSSCSLRYETYLFYQQTPAPTPGPATPNGSTNGKSGNNTTKIAIIASTLLSSAVLAAVLGLFYWSRSRRRKRRHSEEERSQVILLGNLEGSNQTHVMEGGMHLAESDSNVRYFSLNEIKAATNNFSSANKLGEGGFGPVYKGKLPDGNEIAVKKLSLTSKQGVAEFRNEVMVIAKLQHKNLVRLLGYSWEGNENLLVYEYLPNTSLDVFLFDPIRCKELDWARRSNVISGTARGLVYLHEDSRLKIIHRDMKASNILLDNDMNPKISDFGTARIFGGNEVEANTDRVVGTYGYMAPEYALEGLISTKSDVYSFGILMLEIISGKKNRGFYNHEQGHGLLSHAWELWNEGNGNDFMDQNIIGDCPTSEVLRWIHIALLCAQDDPALRPSMSQVVLMLGSKSMNLPQLLRAPFFVNSASDHSTTSGLEIGLLISDQSTAGVSN